MVGYVLTICRGHENRHKRAAVDSGTTIQHKVSIGEVNITCNRIVLGYFISTVAIGSALELSGVRQSTDLPYVVVSRRRRDPQNEYQRCFTLKDHCHIC